MLESNAREHFDPAAAERFAIWRLIYLARHARRTGAFGRSFEEMTEREVNAWIEETSETIKAETKPKK